MTWAITSENTVGYPLITAHDTTKGVPLGTIVRATDPTTYGDGEFIYLLGVASTVEGSVVTYDASTWQTVLSAVAGGIPRPLAVAMSACVASEYGWYQISGMAKARKASATSAAAGAAVGILSTGTVAGTASLSEVFGAAFAAIAVATSPTCTICINRPYKQGRID